MGVGTSVGLGVRVGTGVSVTVDVEAGTGTVWDGSKVVVECVGTDVGATAFEGTDTSAEGCSLETTDTIEGVVSGSD